MVEAAWRRRRRQTRRNDAADWLQDISLHLLGEPDKHEWRGEAAFFAWVKRVANAKVVDRARRDRARKRSTALDAPFDPRVHVPRIDGDGVETVVENLRRSKQLRDLLAALRESYAIALRMDAAGYSHAEIAREIGAPTEDAARKTLKRARPVGEAMPESSLNAAALTVGRVAHGPTHNRSGCDDAAGDGE